MYNISGNFYFKTQHTGNGGAGLFWCKNIAFAPNGVIVYSKLSMTTVVVEYNWPPLEV